jgi:hypothetical protein
MSKTKSLLARVEEEARRPVPYEGLTTDPADAGYPSESDEPARSSTEANPSHKEAFTSLVDAAAKKRPQDG